VFDVAGYESADTIVFPQTGERMTDKGAAVVTRVSIGIGEACALHLASVSTTSSVSPRLMKMPEAIHALSKVTAV
jgi:hypothetical protein